jgi:DNA-binding NtrC family response regulator
VRELENAIERAMVLGSSDAIFPEDLPESIVESAPSVHHAAENYYQAIADFKRQLISRALQNAGGNYIAAAEALGVHPNSLLRLMRNLQIRAGQTA